MMLRTAVVALTVAAAISPQCGPSTSTPTTPTTPSTPSTTALQNFQAIVVNSGPANNYFNGAFTTVTICVPGQSACQTIDGVLVDTGSSGLRVLASKLTVTLPQQTDASGAPIAECAHFLDGFTWGPVQTADIRLGGEQAGAVPIQAIGATGFSNNIPSACANSGTPENTVDALGANGILGVGLFRQDCGSACVGIGASNPGFYYSCPSSGCRTVAQTLTGQLQNPVWLFATDNNGVAIQLQSLPSGGALTATGMLIFGIGTQSDNALGAAKVLTVDADGNVTTVYGGQPYTSSFIDSGSNGIFFLDAKTTGLPVCTTSTDFYCPASPQSFSATLRGVNAATAAVTFNVGNADTHNGRFSAFSDVAGPSPGNFDWGLSFFFGRTIFTAIEGQSTPGGPGPYFAF